MSCEQLALNTVVIRRSQQALASVHAADACLGSPQWSSMTRIKIEWQNSVGRWQHILTRSNQIDAFRAAQDRARRTGERHRLVDQDGRLLDVIDP